MAQDPVESNPDHYTVVFENDRVRVLEYRDVPGHISVAHRHPDSVMITASGFRRRLHSDGSGPLAGGSMDVELPAGAVRWLPAQEHYGENTGDTDTHAFFVELKEPNPKGETGGALGPTGG